VPVPAIAALLVALLVGNVLIVAALVSLRRNMSVARGAMPLAGEPVDVAIQLTGDPESRPAAGSGIRLATYRRVIQIVSSTFFVVTAVVVAGGGLWPTEAPAIYLVLLVGAGSLFVLDELGPRMTDLGTVFVVEAAAAVTFFTLLVVLTGGVVSPFFFGYFLIVAAAALVTGGGASLVLAAAITAAYLGALLVTRGGATYTTEQIVVVSVNVMALWLLSYLASVVAGEQRRTRDAALRLSLHDPLTRLYNRTFLFAVIEREIARAGRTNRRFSLLMLDLDGLKPINDRYGHYFGDRMLQAVAEAIRQGIRVIDTAARYGGDEFVVLLPETDPEGAAVVAEKLRRSVASIRLNAGTELLDSTASIGVVAFPEDGRTADALTNRADQVMYGAKRAGRNRVSIEGHAPGPAEAFPVTQPDGARQRQGGGNRTARPVSARPTVVSSAPRRRTRRAPLSGARTTERSRGASHARPSMFTQSYPRLPDWVRPRSTPWARGAGAVGVESSPAQPANGAAEASPVATSGEASPMSTSRGPTARARRFLVEHPEDRTFDRTMHHFLRGEHDPGGKQVDPYDR
jgi:diguanylate cyclase (GGDEF)-like protein